MSGINRNSDNPGGEEPRPQLLLEVLKVRYEAGEEVRRGICLLNAGRFKDAEEAFSRAAATASSNNPGYTGRSLPSLLAGCLLGQQQPDRAADQFARVLDADQTQTVTRIRHALALWSAGRRAEAILSLREGVRLEPEGAELHFQLGVLLTSLEQYDEAELRFTQAANIDPEHTEALVHLALCHGLKNSPGEALICLQRAQKRRPHDPRIGMLLSQAAEAARQQGHSVRLRAEMSDGDQADDEQGILELARVIEAEPDFVDAFLALPGGQLDERIFALLLRTLAAALARQPEHSELHYQCGRLLARLGRNDEAISQNERAVELNPTCVRALIELGKLYHQTDRRADAMTRLEQAIAAGADFADVYYLLGNLYRDQGKVSRARSAYRHALLLNDRYEAALRALETLPAA
jgi:tetratricopeptide (TPR) repeat protein